MYNKKIKVYKQTDKKENLWDVLGEELGFTGRLKLNLYLFLLVLGQSVICRFIVLLNI